MANASPTTQHAATGVNPTPKHSQAARFNAATLRCDASAKPQIVQYRYLAKVALACGLPETARCLTEHLDALLFLRWRTGVVQ